MYLKTLKLEKDALKVFRQEEADQAEQERKEWWNDIMPVQVYDMHNGEDTEMRDIENFEGGRGEQFDVEAIGNNFSKKMSSKKKRTGCLQLLGFGKNNSGLGNQKWEDLTKEQQKKKIENWWAKVRRYNNKLRLQARLQKMAEQNLREMMIDDIQDDEEDDNTAEDQQTKIKWYLIDSDNTFCKTWDMLITFVTIYNLFVVPIVIVF